MTVGIPSSNPVQSARRYSGMSPTKDTTTSITAALLCPKICVDNSRLEKPRFNDWCALFLVRLAHPSTCHLER